MPTSAALQIALDVTSQEQAVRLARSVAPHAAIIEAGTPLLFETGLAIVPALKAAAPGCRILADLKIVDAGHLEAGCAFARGADLVTVLGVADDATVAGALRAAQKAGGRIMVDLLQVPDLAARAAELLQLGVDCFCLHTAYDRQGSGVDPLAELHALRRRVGSAQLAVAGGLGAANVGTAAASGADIVVVGGAIVNQPDPAATAAAIARLLTEARHG